MFKERPVRKLVDWYVDPYIIEEAVFTNVIKLRLLNSIRIYLVVNVNQVVQYRKLVERQKMEEVKPAEVNRVKVRVRIIV